MRLRPLLALALLCPALTLAQQRRAPTLRTPAPPPPNDDAMHPYATLDALAAVTRGPFLLEPSDTTATIVWVTDSPAAARVEYGTSALNHSAEPEQDGLVPIGTVHRVELTGLAPGTRYQYRVVSTRVVRVKPYWPDLGHAAASPVYSFTTFSPDKAQTSFVALTDTHENVARIHALLGPVDWKTTDFLVNLGDGVNWAQDEDQVFDHWIAPLTDPLAHSVPLIYARGNHDLRGPFARSLARYLTTPDDPHYYYTRRDGPLDLIAVDTGEDKPDATPVYSHLNDLAAYRARELVWFRSLAASPSTAAAPFRVVLMHQPYWGWLDGHNADWAAVANKIGVDLVIAGHWHRFAYFPAGTAGEEFPTLVLGQDQLAHVTATTLSIHVEVTDRSGKSVHHFDVLRRQEP